jgi:hypothetical protein
VALWVLSSLCRIALYFAVPWTVDGGALNEIVISAAGFGDGEQGDHLGHAG